MNTGFNEIILKEIHARSFNSEDPSGRSASVIHESDARQIAGKFNRSLNDIYIASLASDIWPQRYIRNHDTLNSQEQSKLARARVAVIGCGGLGGHVLLMLSRLGSGSLVVVDPDTFDESNLNRQAFANSDTIGMHKTIVAATDIKSINPAVTVKQFQSALNNSNASQIINDSDVVVDALDNIADRKILTSACCQKKIPIVHGAIAGFEGQVISIFPEDGGYNDLFDNSGDKNNHPDMNAELLMGVPSITPVFIASLQAMEVVKILLNRGNLFSQRMLYSDIELGEFNYFDF
ncbi:MAG: HesA/MoeB/ThiF family protein [Desulfobacteraceae bacterium]|jgi:molybdopterin/thiamine biosynthesis adenylyltransferase|nr:HesA/MoeB/ThiF family protein [Desulfobacteraceae bacterium]